MHWSVYVLVSLVLVVLVFGLSNQVVIHETSDAQTNVTNCCTTPQGMTCAVLPNKDCSLCIDYCS